jgi:hypothetical protein
MPPVLPKANFGTLTEVLKHADVNWRPLPPVHEGNIYQYTGIAGAHGIIKTNTIWASHSLCLNDPSERHYGWEVIREARNSGARIEGSDFALSQIDQILDNQQGWYPESYIASASLESDSLTQFRLYGSVELSLPGGEWETMSRNRIRDDHALVIGGYPQMPVGAGYWRKVWYGRKEANPPILDMFNTVSAYIDSFKGPTNKGYNPLAAFMALEYLSLHIKNPDYQVENEVRLVATETQAPATVEVREVNGKLIPYIEVRPKAQIPDEAEDIVKSIILGPGAGGLRNRKALEAHMARNTRTQGRIYYPVPINDSQKEFNG